MVSRGRHRKGGGNGPSRTPFFFLLKTPTALGCSELIYHWLIKTINGLSMPLVRSQVRCLSDDGIPVMLVDRLSESSGQSRSAFLAEIAILTRSATILAELRDIRRLRGLFVPRGRMNLIRGRNRLEDITAFWTEFTLGWYAHLAVWAYCQDNRWCILRDGLRSHIWSGSLDYNRLSLVLLL